MSILAVITSFSRPGNVPRIIDALKKQSVDPPEVVVVDNRPADADPQLYIGADDVWRFHKNLGCPCHFAPALSILGYKYTWFIDDDVIPGPRSVELLTGYAKVLNDDFASLGFTGRLFKNQPGHRYDPRNHPSKRLEPVICNNVCRMQFVLTANFEAVPLFRNRMLKENYAEAMPLCSIHDDLLLNLSVQWHRGAPSYVVPFDLIDLDDKKGLWRRPTHVMERCRFVELALKCGWRPITEETMKLD